MDHGDWCSEGYALDESGFECEIDDDNDYYIRPARLNVIYTTTKNIFQRSKREAKK